MIQEDEDILAFLCTSNGIDVNCHANERSRIEKLEAFFSGFPKIISLSTFPNLSELIIVNQPIKIIENLDSCINLTSLWICECEIVDIEGLEQCGQIRNLYLYDNKIMKIKNLDSLRLLECLWLNNNLIKVIEGLNELMILDELNLAGNMIKTIGNTLKANISIEKLNLSGNSIDNLDDILNLCQLPKLKHLNINGPDYVPNPIFSFTNYFLFILYHFSNLKTLDTFDVNCSYLRDVVLNIVGKKKMFYFMKKETLHRSCEFTKLQLKQTYKEVLSSYESSLRSVNHVTKMIEQRQSLGGDEFLGVIDEALISRDQYEETLANVRVKSREMEEVCDAIQSELDFYLQRSELQYSEMIDLHQLELSSCGNFKFELSSDKLWANLCTELLNSRFCNYEAKNYSLIKVKSERVIKVKNIQVDKSYAKTIRTLESKNDVSEPLDQDLRECKNQDYLFLRLEEDDGRTILQILDSFYSRIPPKNGFTVTNSLYFGDMFRNKWSVEDVPSKLRYGRVIVVKTFVGLVKTEDYSKVPPKVVPDCSKIALKNCSPNNNSICACVNYKYEWIFKDSSLLVPEYVVDFEYISKESVPKSPFYNTFHRCKNDPREGPEPGKEVEKIFGDIRRQMEYDTVSKNMVKFLKGIPENGAKTRITSLNLTSCHLSDINELESLENLVELVLAFNCLTSLRDVSNKKLKILDASFNSIQSLDQMKDLLALKTLDLQHNLLVRTREEISLLHNHVPNLTDLNVKYNYFQKPETVRLRIIGRLKSLKMLNQKEVSESEARIALDLVFKSRITEADIVEFGRIDTIRPRTLVMDDVASILLRFSHNKLSSPINDFSKFLRITSLSLNDQNLSKISNLDGLENLKYLSLSRNYISRIEGLDHCSHLEELILDHNTITKIENLARLQKLKKVSLNANQVSSLAHLRNVPSLQTLSVHTNKLASLAGLELCESLSELYAANNFISDSSEITGLKVLANLLILDLFNNPIAESSGGTTGSKNYRLNVVFHLKQLKALDGVSIDSGEVNQSKEVLGGRLNLDFIREKVGSDSFADVAELDLSNCLIKSVDLNPVERLRNLRSLNLENNHLTSLSGLIQMTNLKVLCLNSNFIESVVPRTNLKMGIQPIQGKTDSDRKVHLSSLEVLHLGYNNIKSLGQLGLQYIPSLKALFLQGNDISSIEGLDSLVNLRELVLDQNRIKAISENAFVNNVNLREIHLEDNRLKTVTHIYHLRNLKRLYLGNNKISDLQDLDLFYSFESLLDISLYGNPICRKQLHRQYLIHMLPSLLMIDGLEVTEDEKMRLETTFDDTDSNVLPGIVVQNKMQSIKPNSLFYSQNDLSKGDFLKKRQNHTINPYNLVNKNSVQLVANTKAVYFYDPISQNDNVPRLYMNKKK